MGKLEGMIKFEIVRLAKREMRKISVPLKRDVWSLKNTVSQLKKTVSSLQRITTQQQKELGKKSVPLDASPEELKSSRFSPRLIRSLRKRLGITQKDLSVLADVTLGAIHQWESGLFRPRESKKKVLVALRKLGRREVKALLGEKKIGQAEKGGAKARSRARKRASKKRK